MEKLCKLGVPAITGVTTPMRGIDKGIVFLLFESISI